MKSQKLVFGNLEGLVKKETSNTSEKMAELRTFAPCKAIDLTKFISDESFKISGDLKKLDTSDLIARAKFGCAESFNVIDLEIRDYLKVTSVSSTQADKKNNSLVFDSVQDTIVKVYENILIGGFDTVEDIGGLRAKSRSILKNIMFDIADPKRNNYYSKTRLFKVSDDGEYEINSVNSQGKKTTLILDNLFTDEKFDDAGRIERSLNKLRDSQKEIIDLYYFQNWSHTAISEGLDISENSSMIKLSRAKAKLKEEYLKM